MTIEMLEIMGYGICRLKPWEFYELTWNELIKMTTAITDYKLITIEKYKPRKSEEENKETLAWLRSMKEKDKNG